MVNGCEFSAQTFDLKCDFLNRDSFVRILAFDFDYGLIEIEIKKHWRKIKWKN